LALSSGFFCRKSKLSPEDFFDLLFYAASMPSNSSLEHLCSCLSRQYGIRMSKQSLDERFNTRTVHFVKAVLSALPEEQFSGFLYDCDFLSAFEHVRIKDSTKFNLPSNMAEHYRGSGGNETTSSAGISIQYEFDLKSGKIPDLSLTEAVRPDRRDAGETIDNVCHNDLVIRDLGYFSVSVVQSFANRGAFFRANAFKF
jgi:hypothetical protein